MDDRISEDAALRWIVAGLAAAAIYIVWPLWPALILAAWTAALARPMLSRFERGREGRRRAAATLSILLVVLVSVPLVFIVLVIVSGAEELLQAIGQSSSARSALEAITGVPARGRALPIPRDIPAFVELLKRFGAQGTDLLSLLAGAATTGFVALFIYVGGAYAFLLEGPAIRRWLDRYSPLDEKHLARLASAFQETGRGLLTGVGLTSATQGLVATIAYLALDIPRWWVLGPMTGLASMIPVVGSALVWVPIMLGLFVTGHPVKAAILAGIGIGVISTVDNVLRPVYSRLGALRMPTFLLFVSMFGGIAAMGPWGAILGPLVIRLLMEALALRREALEAGDATRAK